MGAFISFRAFLPFLHRRLLHMLCLEECIALCLPSSGHVPSLVGLVQSQLSIIATGTCKHTMHNLLSPNLRFREATIVQRACVELQTAARVLSAAFRTPMTDVLVDQVKQFETS